MVITARNHWWMVSAALWAVLSAGLLLTPGRGLPPTISVSDKAAHFALFLVQAWLLLMALQTHRARRPLLWAAVATVAYAGLLELAQLWAPGRSWELMDLVAGAAGALAAVVIGLWRRRASL